jgi:HK97 family phage portal protein
LWPLRPDLVRILPTRNPRVWDYGYILDPSTNARNVTTEVVQIPRGDMIHVKYPNPLDAYFGQPPLRAAARAVSLDNAATDFVDRLLRNDATPTLVVTTQEAITDELADRLRAKWNARFSGTGRGKGPAFLQKGMDVKPLGLNLRDLEFPDLRSISETRICMTFKVPPILVGAKVGLDRSTFSNYREARVSLWEESIMPLQRRFGDAIQTRLLPEFTGVGRSRVQMRWDNSDVLALREGEKDKWERATNALARGGVSINDFRRTVGLEPVGGGDVFLIPAGVVPSPIDGIAAVPDQAEVEATAQRPQLEAAAYADRFLAELSRKQAVNGHALVG